MKEYDKNKYVFYYKILCVVIIGSIVFWLLAFVASRFFGIYVSGDSIISGLVGALATFVVISNYTQVKELENRFEPKIEEMRNEIAEIKKIKTEILDNTSKKYEIEKIIRACKLYTRNWIDIKETILKLEDYVYTNNYGRKLIMDWLCNVASSFKDVTTETVDNLFSIALNIIYETVDDDYQNDIYNSYANVIYSTIYHSYRTDKRTDKKLNIESYSKCIDQFLYYNHLICYKKNIKEIKNLNLFFVQINGSLDNYNVPIEQRNEFYKLIEEINEERIEFGLEDCCFSVK